MMDASVWIKNKDQKKTMVKNNDDRPVFTKMNPPFGTAGYKPTALKNIKTNSPSSAKSFKEMGDLLVKDNAMEGAAECYRKAIQIQPSWLDPYCALGNLLLRQQHTISAEEVFNVAMKHDPKNIDVTMGLGMSLIQQMRAEEALACFEKAIDLKPDHQEAWLQKAAALEIANRTSEASDVIGEAKARFPDWKLSVLELKLARRNDTVDDALKMMQQKIGRISEKNPDNFRVFFEMGFLYEQKGDADQAFDYFRKGNQCLMLSAAARRFNDSDFIKQIDESIVPLTPEWLTSWTQSPAIEYGPSPVFIVGFPRSGTTLLDQILGSHPEVSVIEEPPGIFEAVKNITDGGDSPFPTALAKLDNEQIHDLRKKYLSVLKARGANLDKPVIIDKNPLNMVRMNTIYRLFPDAKIIMTLRHPCDSVLSCFMQPFALNMATYMFLDIEKTALLYDKAFSAWEKYREVLPLKTYIVKYEDVVTDFRPTVEGVLDHIGLSWNDDMAMFHEKVVKRGTVRTASYSQVAKELYTTAQNRWVRYKKHMEPVLDILKPWCKRYGYELND